MFLPCRAHGQGCTTSPFLYLGNFGPSVGLSSIEQSHCSTLAQKVCHLFTYVHDLSAMIRHTTPELNFHYETGHG
jgi:hypothetical protein